MVTTTFSKETAIRVQIPHAEGQVSEKTKQVLTLTIDKSGRYIINDQAVKDKSKQALMQALKAASHKQVPLLINADANAPVQAAISVLDVATQIGFKNITFATQKK